MSNSENVVVKSVCSAVNPPGRLPPSLPGLRHRSLGTVCAESCRYGTMTGWTKVTTNEITLQERFTPPGVGAAPGAPRHFST